jgi:hypothetical protein
VTQIDGTVLKYRTAEIYHTAPAAWSTLQLKSNEINGLVNRRPPCRERVLKGAREKRSRNVFNKAKVEFATEDQEYHSVFLIFSTGARAT